MRYLSVCSGIEAATAAWHPLGWEPVAFSEVDAFPSAVLKHHYPSVPNWGDMTKFQEWLDADVDVLVGGTPCQSFSVAGLRKGLDDPRGNLMLTYLAIARRYRPRWVVWENVPGVLSSNRGRDFGTFLGGLAECGYGFAYRVLDAQHFGLAQRRKRVFVVGCLGDWRRAAAVLFERESLSGHPAPRREAGQVAPTVPARRTAGGGFGTDFDCDGGLIPQVANPLTARMHKGINTTCDEGQTMVAHSLRADGFDASEDGTSNAILTASGGRAGIGVGAVAFTTEQEPKWNADQALTLTKGSPTGGGQPQAVAFAQNQRDEIRTMDTAGALDAEPGMKQQTYLAQHMAVRRLTPRECERLQGFPDDYLDIPYRGKPAADGPKYKALGNSFAVPVVRWIGQRIQMVEGITNGRS